MKTPILSLALAAMVLSACDTPNTATRGEDPDLLRLNATAPAGAAPGTCWDKTVDPAVVETVTEDILVQPAQISSSGTVQAPPIYRNLTRQKIVVPRRENWFQTPCPAQMTPQFIASVQRALQARGTYSGPISGVMDDATRAAVLALQAEAGSAAPSLTIETARKLGLWTVDREELAIKWNQAG